MQQTKERSFFKSLKGKIALYMLLVSLVPMAVVGGLMVSSMYAAESQANDSVDDSRKALSEDTIADTMATQAWNLSMDLESWMAERISEVKTWASNQSIVEAASNGYDENNAAQNFLRDKVGTGRTGPYFGDAYIAGASGQQIVQVEFGGGDGNKEIAEQAWVEGYARGLYVSNIYLATKEGVYSYYVDVSVLIEDKTAGDRLGVLVGSVVVHPLRLAQEYGAKVPDYRLLILDPTRVIIADSLNPDRYQVETPTWNETEQAVIIKITDDAKAIEPQHVETNDYFAGFARATNENVTIQFPEFKGLGWTVMVEQSSEQALAPLASLEELEDDLNNATSSMLITLLIVLVVVIIIVPVVAYFVSQSIIKPVAKLRDAAEKVSMGDMSATVEVETDDEIGDLSESFERMVMAVRFLSQEEEE